MSILTDNQNSTGHMLRGPVLSRGQNQRSPEVRASLSHNMKVHRTAKLLSLSLRSFPYSNYRNAVWVRPEQKFPKLYLACKGQDQSLQYSSSLATQQILPAMATVTPKQDRDTLWSSQNQSPDAVRGTRLKADLHPAGAVLSSLRHVWVLKSHAAALTL